MNCDELYDKINTLGKVIPVLSSKAYEEYEGAVFIHKLYVIRGAKDKYTEDDLCTFMYNLVEEAINKYDSPPDIFWRRCPTIDESIDELQLSMRVSIGSTSTSMPTILVEREEGTTIVDIGELHK